MADFGAGAIFGGINTCFKFSEFAIALRDVGKENAVFARTIQRVRYDLEETERLLHLPEVKLALARLPGKIIWINDIIKSTKTALNDIGLYVERVRSEKDRENSISFENRVRWVLKDHEKLKNRSMELNTCHISLSSVLDLLQRLEQPGYIVSGPGGPGEVSIPQEAPPTYDTIVGECDFQGPHARRKTRRRVNLFDVKSTDKQKSPLEDEATSDKSVGIRDKEYDTPKFNLPDAPALEDCDNGLKAGLMSHAAVHVASAGTKPPTNPPPDKTNQELSGTNPFGPVNPWPFQTKLPGEGIENQVVLLPRRRASSALSLASSLSHQTTTSPHDTERTKADLSGSRYELQHPAELAGDAPRALWHEATARSGLNASWVSQYDRSNKPVEFPPSTVTVHAPRDIASRSQIQTPAWSHSRSRSTSYELAGDFDRASTGTPAGQSPFSHTVASESRNEASLSPSPPPLGTTFPIYSSLSLSPPVYGPTDHPFTLPAQPPPPPMPPRSSFPNQSYPQFSSHSNNFTSPPPQHLGSLFPSHSSLSLPSSAYAEHPSLTPQPVESTFPSRLPSTVSSPTFSPPISPMLQGQAIYTPRTGFISQQPSLLSLRGATPMSSHVSNPFEFQPLREVESAPCIPPKIPVSKSTTDLTNTSHLNSTQQSQGGPSQPDPVNRGTSALNRRKRRDAALGIE